MLEKSIIDLLEFRTKHFSDNLNQNRNSLKELLELLGDLSESLKNSKVKVKSWEYYSETIIHKILLHSHSICELTKGFGIESERLKMKSKIIDFPSIFILTRAALESFLTLEYIYMANIPEEEKFFRFKLWEVSGLLTRQNFNTGEKIELKKKKNVEKKLINKIRNEIEKDPKFSKLSKHQLSKLGSYGLPRLDSWNNMIENSSLNSRNFKDMYKLYSNYAHSEYLSILQIKQSNFNISNKEALANTNLSIKIIQQLISLIIEWLINNFKSAEVISNTFPKHLNFAVKRFASIAKGTC